MRDGRPVVRFVVANRRAQRFSNADKLESRHALGAALHLAGAGSLVADHAPADQLARRIAIVDATLDEAEAMRAAASGALIVEPLILHGIDDVTPPDLRGALPATIAPTVAGGPAFASETLAIRVTGAGSPLARATVSVFFRVAGSPQPLRVIATTGADGRANVRVPPGAVPAAAVVVPAQGYWTMVVRGSAIDQPIDCPALPADGPLGWWHHRIGLAAVDLNAGEGIAVGIVDTGCGPHGALAHVELAGAFIDNSHAPGAAAHDVDSHGTHVAGTIGARPATGAYAGIAPGARLVAARVFRSGLEGATNADIAAAIDATSRDRGCDLINLSLGSSIRSEVIEDAVLDALERGTLCIAAAGNDGASVSYPAALDAVVAVSALGLAGWGPPGSAAASRLPREPDRFGTAGLYLADFSNFGTQIDCSAPGVGLIAAVPGLGPPGGELAMDGTSMAAPVVCGALASLLSRNAAWRRMPRDQGRADAAREILRVHLKSVGLRAIFQGLGAMQAA